jgi:hypothetical protein
MAKARKHHRSAFRVLTAEERTAAILGLGGHKPHPPRWNKQLLCYLDDWVTWKGDREVNLVVGRGNSPDMRGAIDVAMTLMPGVEVIGVYQDTTRSLFRLPCKFSESYERTGDTWTAFRADETGRFRIAE